ncbi:ABC transporter ATP-binding protein [Actinomadura madurae]|uniref:ABC transporter ATP-binding protein n=1 Tax=Actinomadura madurae TaxID=1993 RepID=UPI0020271F42|nr:ABC transporter ATP-binding protein [Actinomadura madurae]MCP9972069.1 ABC transporter ATP-binding protein [Actinomadura madurae]MCQ0003880.1 ABC transporter ATP-binding protein [Actinomadura madurae]URN00799.1 ABC transporter ATP-binding protein [Actinomadura madurae]URN02944.1 ABC transporter ATP-binding protein [Actinomadura madurae]
MTRHSAKTLGQSRAEAPPGSSPEGKTGTAAKLELIGIGKEFRSRRTTTQALSGIDLTISDGEFVSVIGRSGCGKTTLLRMLAGLLGPSTGEILVEGSPLWHGSRVDSSVVSQLGVVFQEANLFPWYSVADNISLPLRLRGAGKRERRDRAHELAELVGLAGFESSYPRELSGGMRQRAAIARALSTGPKLLLMDEPFGALDALTRERMNLELQRIALATDATVVFVTHDITEAVFLGDRVVHLTPRPGRIRQITPVGFERPRGIDVQTEPEFGAIVRGLRHALDEEE